MNTYTLKYHKNNVLISAMAGIPVISIVLMFYFLFNIPVSSTELSILGLTLLFTGSIFTILTWIKKSQIFVRAKISISDEGLSIQLKKSSLLYRRLDYFLDWEDITSITEMFDNHNGGFFYQIHFKSSNFAINLGVAKGAEKEASLFFSELQYYQEQKVAGHEVKPRWSFNL